MIKKLIKWLWDAQRQVDELNSKLNAIGISIDGVREKRNNFTGYMDVLEIICEGLTLPEDFNDEIMMDDFWYGTDFEAFWQEYKEIFENVTECQQNSPWNIGDTVYCVNGYGSQRYIEEFTVAEIRITKDGIWLTDTNGMEWLARVCHFSRESADRELRSDNSD